MILCFSLFPPSHQNFASWKPYSPGSSFPIVLSSLLGSLSCLNEPDSDFQPLKWKNLITLQLIRPHWSVDQHPLLFLQLLYIPILPASCNATLYLLSFRSFTEVFGTLSIGLLFTPRAIIIQMFTSLMRTI